MKPKYNRRIRMIEYYYKQICEDCVVFGVDRNCDNCSGVGYTESIACDKSDIPNNAYDIEEENNECK
tara:strand:+ start:138 stop:338 length:201 start_codon:yes stop_codon:yes gene_type:complete